MSTDTSVQIISIENCNACNQNITDLNKHLDESKVCSKWYKYLTDSPELCNTINKFVEIDDRDENSPIRCEACFGIYSNIGNYNRHLKNHIECEKTNLFYKIKSVKQKCSPGSPDFYLIETVNKSFELQHRLFSFDLKKGQIIQSIQINKDLYNACDKIYLRFCNKIIDCIYTEIRYWSGPLDIDGFVGMECHLFNKTHCLQYLKNYEITLEFIAKKDVILPIGSIKYNVYNCLLNDRCYKIPDIYRYFNGFHRVEWSKEILNSCKNVFSWVNSIYIADANNKITGDLNYTIDGVKKIAKGGQWGGPKNYHIDTGNFSFVEFENDFTDPDIHVYIHGTRHIRYIDEDYDISYNIPYN